MKTADGEGERQINFSWPEREMLAGLVFLAALILVSALFPAAVGTGPQAPLLRHAAAPWIFGPIQVLLLYVPPLVGAWLIPGVFAAFLFLFPWLSKGRGARPALYFFAFFVGAVLVLLAMYVWLG
ncbi:Cytochrome b/b6-like domain protein [Acididesulfobacillus acetoxydans]|uniref:Cytochrome b/b6-like domain protein n=1 Tax=Acididesulfobacillus acetoxydans TaxID=1561005 RepID=A0A8S0VW51_9FIRM|nr:hypothetical protein [Acididesulfobacillus acetoxydans]CAA7600433.1 Cytochrome b/b6-like domain protein [Acididesulfobacillus acetoxydans]CEJ06567.1 Hypothetical protein DEACI_1016 [Acididesulfobacillus acetoxydans]